MKFTLIITSVFCIFLLTIFGFNGFLPSWLGGLGWFFLLVGYVYVAFQYYVEEREEINQLRNIAGQLSKMLERIKND